MKTPSDDKSGFRAIVRQWAVDGIGFVVAILFFFILGTIVIVATASSKSPWDTLIAAMAMVSQAFFAYMVWQLGKNQFTFAQKTTERQHKIDMFPLYKTALERLEKAGDLILPPRVISDEAEEEFRMCHLEINKLFSDQADDIAFDLYQTISHANRLYKKSRIGYDFNTSQVVVDAKLEEGALARLNEAIDIYSDLQSLIDDEMRIH